MSNKKPKLSNLKPFNTYSKEEHRELSRKGGIMSGKTKRKRKELKEELEIIMSQKYDDLFENNITYQEKLCKTLIEQAIEGNIKAFEVIRDTLK